MILAQRLIEEIINEVHKKFPNLKKSVVERVIRSQFRLLKEEIQTGQFNIIQLPYLGKFYPNKQALKRLIRKNARTNKTNPSGLEKFNLEK